MSKQKRSGKAAVAAGAVSPAEFDFHHHLHDTIILLGGRKEIAEMVERSQDSHIKNSDVAELRRYNGRLIDDTKDRLTTIHKTKVRAKSAA